MRAALRSDGRPLQVALPSGLLEGVPYLPSPNCDDRPAASQPQLVVLHGISLPPGQYGGPWIEQLFTNSLSATAHPYFAGLQGLRVSAHVLLRRDGRQLQFVPFSRRAWHAGESCWQGRERCNDYSVGIELEGTDSDPYSEAQYASLVQLLFALFDAYPALGPETIAGHSDVAPGRKTDPGPAFDWPRLRALLRRRAGHARPGVPS